MNLAVVNVYRGEEDRIAGPLKFKRHWMRL
jgi:hypothetical protein